MQEIKDLQVLVVEDDLRMSESIRHLLCSQGYIVQTSMNICDALFALIFNHYDLVLLDLKLEDQSGFVVMDYLSHKNLDTQVVVITGQHSMSNYTTAQEKGAAGYLKKPFEPDELLDFVEKVMNRKNLTVYKD